jgi:hypothetical protein
MSFLDLLKLRWSGVVTGPGSETVTHTPVTDDGPQTPESVSAQVYEGTRENPAMVSRLGRTGQLPIYVTCQKADLTSLRVKKSRITWNWNEYEVKEILYDDGAVVELYCGR